MEQFHVRSDAGRIGDALSARSMGGVREHRNGWVDVRLHGVVSLAAPGRRPLTSHSGPRPPMDAEPPHVRHSASRTPTARVLRALGGLKVLPMTAQRAPPRRYSPVSPSVASLTPPAHLSQPAHADPRAPSYSATRSAGRSGSDRSPFVVGDGGSQIRSSSVGQNNRSVADA